jgi:hypothetical protein
VLDDLGSAGTRDSIGQFDSAGSEHFLSPDEVLGSWLETSEQCMVDSVGWQLPRLLRCDVPAFSENRFRAAFSFAIRLTSFS